MAKRSRTSGCNLSQEEALWLESRKKAKSNSSSSFSAPTQEHRKKTRKSAAAANSSVRRQLELEHSHSEASPSQMESHGNTARKRKSVNSSRPPPLPVLNEQDPLENTVRKRKSVNSSRPSPLPVLNEQDPLENTVRKRKSLNSSRPSSPLPVLNEQDPLENTVRKRKSVNSPRLPPLPVLKEGEPLENTVRKRKFDAGPSIDSPRRETGHSLISKKRCLPSVSVEQEDDDGSDMDLSSTPILTQMGSPDEHLATCNSEKMLHVAEVGVIDKLTLINFMCHRRLDLSLSPNVNFILGQNGSGKSAIMTGIVVGLGGNARSTERGRSLKQFVRSGERTGEVRVTLRNRGIEAYRPEVYGEFIMVERVISSDGAGSYKIKNSKGKTISTKKEELTNLLDHCGVQVDNPVSLLNQDTSRTFLQKSTPGDKYKLFMKATRLEQIAMDYEQAGHNQKMMGMSIKKKEELLPDYRSNAKVLEEKVDSFERLMDMESKVQNLKMELQWGLVAELEMSISPIERDIGKEKARIPRNLKKMEESKAEVMKVEEDERTVSDQLGEAVSEASSLHTEREGVMTVKKGIDRSLRELNAKMKHIAGEVREKETEKNCLKTTRDNCIALSQRDVEGEKALRETELQQLHKKLAKVEGEIATAENDKKQFDGAVMRVYDREAELRRKVEAEDASLAKSNDCVKRLKSSHNDRLAMFGQQMKMLVDAVQKSSSRFNRPPIGPLGAMIRLQDYTWATAVEQLVKRAALHSFVVDNHRDEATLRGIIRSVYGGGGFKPEVIVSSFQSTAYDVRKNRPHCNYLTVFDVLDVRDPNIMNVLIDQFSVESTLLFQSRDEASRVIVHERPRGAKSAYTMEGDQVLQHAHYSNKQGKFGILKESIEAALRDEEAHFEGLRKGLGDLQQELDELKRSLGRDRQCVREAASKIKRKGVEKRNLSSRMEELTNAQEEEEPEEDIATYDAEIAELDEIIAGLRDQLNELRENHKKLDEEKLECFQKCESYDREVERVSSKVINLKSDFNGFSHKKNEVEQRIKFFQDRISEIQNSVVVMESRIADQKEKIKAAVSAAEEVCERIETDRSHKSIQSEIVKLQRRIEKDLPDREEQEKIKDEYIAAMEIYVNTEKAIENEQFALTAIHRSMEFRKNTYAALQDRIAHRTRIYFRNFLHQRDYDGVLRFNHDKEKLEIDVVVDRHTAESKSTKNTKCLSGGERSFTTVCFIMSLWEAMEAPFRCLDEFDVFMDQMVRRISMRLMLEHAQEQLNRQFMFFTPLDMSAIGLTLNDKVKVLKLNPPERGGQTTLNIRQ